TCAIVIVFYFFFQAEDGIRDRNVTGVQTCALPISSDLKDLATATQTPVYMLTGESTNVTAEALSAISSGYQQRIEQNKRALTMSYEKIFDLGAHQDPSLGEPESGLEMRWAEFRPYSLTQRSEEHTSELK